MSEKVIEDSPKSIPTLFYRCIFSQEIPQRLLKKLDDLINLSNTKQNIAKVIMEILDCTNIIINDILTPCSNDETESGHVAIIKGTKI